MKKSFLSKARQDPPALLHRRHAAAAPGDRLQAKASNVLARAVVHGQFNEDSSDEDAIATRAPVPHTRAPVPHDDEDAESFTFLEEPRGHGEESLLCEATVVTQSTAGLSLGSSFFRHMARDDMSSIGMGGGMSTTQASNDVHMEDVPGGFSWTEDRRGEVPEVTTVHEHDEGVGALRQSTSFAGAPVASHQRPVLSSDVWPEGLHTGFGADAGGGGCGEFRPTVAFDTPHWKFVPPPPPPGYSPLHNNDDGWGSRRGLHVGGDEPTVASSLTGSRLHMPATQTASGEEPKAARPGVAMGDGKQMGVPKAALYTLYSKPPYRINLSTENYYCWNDGGPPHNMRFTGIFCCPQSGEIFQSGRYGDDASLYQYKDGLYWYAKKGLAEHGAAARAHDCLQYRSVPEGSLYFWVGDDIPYRTARPMEAPPSMPAAQWQKLVQAQRRAPLIQAGCEEATRPPSRVVPIATMSPVRQEEPVELEREVYGSKGALYTFYTKPPYRTNLTSDHYISWSDGGPAHDMRFTSVFICPWTGEIFPAGPLGGNRVCEWKHGSWWYQKKTLAEHAAAARAHDCQHYRSVPEGSPYARIGREAPYRELRAFVRPPTMPHILWQTLEGVRSRAPHFGTSSRHRYELEEDAALERELFG
jgi:hypothetical protein